MNNDLKNFLEERYNRLYNGETLDSKKEDNRLINFVLELVEKWVEKEKSKEYQCEVHNKPRGITASNYDCTDIHIGRAEALSDISTIINNLRV